MNFVTDLRHKLEYTKSIFKYLKIKTTGRSRNASKNDKNPASGVVFDNNFIAISIKTTKLK